MPQFAWFACAKPGQARVPMRIEKRRRAAAVSRNAGLVRIFLTSGNAKRLGVRQPSGAFGRRGSIGFPSPPPDGWGMRNERLQVGFKVCFLLAGIHILH